MKRRMFYLAATLITVGVGLAAWTMTVRAGYESARYQVLESDGKIEIREYPDLTLAATQAKSDSQGRDGSFMRLFRYIRGANKAEQKIAMTTPVFMEPSNETSEGSMGFVMPNEVAMNGAPEPNGGAVTIRKRRGGRFAVIRFSGRLDAGTAKVQEARLRRWMESRKLTGDLSAETAGYDPPFTPGPFRRNEVLIRLIQSDRQTASAVLEPVP